MNQTYSLTEEDPPPEDDDDDDEEEEVELSTSVTEELPPFTELPSPPDMAAAQDQIPSQGGILGLDDKPDDKDTISSAVHQAHQANTLEEKTVEGGTHEESRSAEVLDESKVEETMANSTTLVVDGSASGDDGHPHISYAQALSRCSEKEQSIHCLIKAGEAPLEPGQFRFPTFIMIGWQKTSTTSLWAWLYSHPEVLGPVEGNKEPEFFTHDCKLNPPENCSNEGHYINTVLRLPEALTMDLIKPTFEASTHYSFHGEILGAKFINMFPWLKIIASLREPISRAASMMIHMADKFQSGCLAQPNVTLYHCLKYHSQISPYDRHPDTIDYWNSVNYNYTYPLSHWMTSTPRDQIYVFQYENMTTSDSIQEAILREVASFIGLTPPAAPNNRLPVKNSRKNTIHPDGWPMKKVEYEELVGMVRPDAEAVAELVERYGLANGAAWLANWEAVWEGNVARCDGEECLIKMS